MDTVAFRVRDDLGKKLNSTKESSVQISNAVEINTLESLPILELWFYAQSKLACKTYWQDESKRGEGHRVYPSDPEKRGEGHRVYPSDPEREKTNEFIRMAKRKRDEWFYE